MYDYQKMMHGIDPDIYKQLGAHITNDGVIFRVYAPNAKRVSVIGDFNYYRPYKNRMKRNQYGVYEVLVKNAKEYDTYKYRITTKSNHVIEKADPFAFYSELRPKTASVIYNIDKFTFSDSDWMNHKNSFYDKPLNVYEVHLGTWKQNNGQYLNYKEAAHLLVDYVKYNHFNFIEFLPLSEHPFDGSWGYQSHGFFSPTARYGEPAELKYLINYAHQNGIGVLLDIVPGHFVKDEHGLILFDGGPLYEYEANDLMYNEWGSISFNLIKNEVRSFLISNAIFWLQEYHFDGLRIDAVANMIYWRGDGKNINDGALEFIRLLNENVHKRFPHAVMIAEDSTAFPNVTKEISDGGLGFDFKWNMGWMNDTLRYVEKDPIYRKYHHNDLTFAMVYNYSEKFMLPLSHDEVVHGKRSLLEKNPGDQWQQFSGLRLLLGLQMTHPGKSLLFMGGEFGQYVEWRDYQELDWMLLQYPYHDSVQRFVREINYIYHTKPALYELDHDSKGFEWIDNNNANQSIISFIRKSKDGRELIVICNFTPTTYHQFKVGVNYDGLYQEIINSDNTIYSGSGVINDQFICTTNEESNGKAYTLEIKLPPLGIVVFEKVE